MKIHVLFVCLGNICRSPTAEAVLVKMVKDQGLIDCIHIDSAGLVNWHEGKPPDLRSQRHGLSRGYDLSDLRARTFCLNDFNQFDIILVMEEANMEALAKLSSFGTQSKVCLLTDYCEVHRETAVPDPYYGTERDFELVIDIIEDACSGLLSKLLELRKFKLGK